MTCSRSGSTLFIWMMPSSNSPSRRENPNESLGKSKAVFLWSGGKGVAVEPRKTRIWRYPGQNFSGTQNFSGMHDTLKRRIAHIAGEAEADRGGVVCDRPCRQFT